MSVTPLVAVGYSVGKYQLPLLVIVGYPVGYIQREKWQERNKFLNYLNFGVVVTF